MKNQDTKNTFSDFWLKKLTPQQRKKRIELAFIPIKTVGKKQISLLDKHEKSYVSKEAGFMYFRTTVKNAWDNIDFAIELGKGRYKSFSFYPTRSVLESLLRLEHYCRQKKDGQNDIALRELLRIAKRFYEREKIENQTGEPYKTIYEEIAKEGSYPSIKDANSKDDPFPSIKKLVEDSPVYTNQHLYLVYEALCELSHGKLLATTQLNEDGFAEHIRSVSELFHLSCNLIKLVDLHIQGITAKEVAEALEKSESIIKNQEIT